MRNFGDGFVWNRSRRNILKKKLCEKLNFLKHNLKWIKHKNLIENSANSFSNLFAWYRKRACCRFLHLAQLFSFSNIRTSSHSGNRKAMQEQGDWRGCFRWIGDCENDSKRWSRIALALQHNFQSPEIKLIFCSTLTSRKRIIYAVVEQNLVFIPMYFRWS